MQMEQINAINIDTENNIYLTDSEDKYLLDKMGTYLITNDKRENEIMANTKKYVSLDKLGLYDEKIKKYLADADGVALQSAKDYADGLAVNYDAAGSANTALESAKAYADGKDTLIAEAKKAGTDAAAAAAVADGKAVAAQGEVDALEAYVGTFTHDTAKSVVEYINAKTDGIATSGNLEALGTRVTAVEGDVATIKGDYLKGSDKTALEGKIEEVQTAVNTEKSRAEGIEAGLETRLAAVEGDYLKAADKTELQGNIDTVSSAVERLTNGVSAEEIDGVNDLIQYVKDHGAEVTGMQGDISKNAEDIAGVAGRMDTAEGKITAVEGAVATKVEQSVYDEKISALEGVDTGLGNRITALEGKFGGADGSVEDMIADAKAEAIATAGTNADTKDEAVLAVAKKYADDEDAKIETRVDALEAIEHHDHANKAELDLIATGDKAKWDAAAAKAHEHGNKTVLDGITAENITTWNTVTSKAAQADLTAVGDRVTAIETWHANFVEVSEKEINGLFA